jgi:membrane protein
VNVIAFVRESARRYTAIDGYDRGLALAAQAFVAVVPMLVVIATWGPSDGSNGTWLIDRLDLDEQTADAVRALLARPPGPTDSVTLLGLAVLIISVLGFARTLQRTFEAAWELPRSGFRGYWPGFLGSAAFVGEVIGLVVLARLLGPLQVATVVIATLWAAVGALAWWPVQRLLVGGRVPWRDLAPGAAVTGIGQAAVMSLASLYLNPALSAQAKRYGEIGVAATFVTGLIALGVLMVVGAVLGPIVAGDSLARHTPSANAVPEDSDDSTGRSPKAGDPDPRPTGQSLASDSERREG